MAAVSLGFVRVWSWDFCLVWVFICLFYIFLLVLYIICFFRSAPARREPPRQPGPAAGTGERGPGPALPQHRDLERATGSRELSSAGSTGRRSRPAAKPRLASPGPTEPRCGAGRSGPPCAPASLARHALPFSFYFFFFSLFFKFSSLSLSLHPFLFALRFLLRFPLFGGWRQVAADTERRLGAHRSPAAHLEASHSPVPGESRSSRPGRAQAPSAATIAAAPGDARCRAAASGGTEPSRCPSPGIEFSGMLGSRQLDYQLISFFLIHRHYNRFDLRGFSARRRGVPLAARPARSGRR